jgi:GNAT superfamily N-acetyltransferase
MALKLRAGKPADAERCGVICYEAFKNIAEKHGFPPDFPSPDIAIGMMSMLFSPHPHVYSVVAERDGRVIGSNFLWEEPPLAGVGPITVDPEVQDGSVGRALMDAVLERGRQQNFVSIRLVQAAYHNRSLSLYTKLGFVAREPLSIMQGQPLAATIPGCAVRTARSEDLDACNALCVRVHGHARMLELAQAIEQKSASLVERAGRITGYATLIGFFGHAVGETDEDLKALIGAAPSFAGVGFLLPTRNTEVFRWCLEQGLRVVQPMTLMSTGLYSKPAGAFLPSILY